MGFLNLLAFGYLSVIGLVVFFYVFNKKKNIIQVPSLIPWGILKEEEVRSRVFRIDLLFLLQILIILLFVFFLAKPYLKSSIINIAGKNVVLVIDTSASMQTIEGNESRFDKARSEALKMVDNLGQWDKMMVISSDYSARIVSNFTGDKAGLNGVIHDLVPGDTGTNLDEGVSLGVSFLKNVERGEMYVLTDRSPSSIHAVSLKSDNIKFVRFGEESANVAISSLDVYQDMFKDYTERAAYITMKNYSGDRMEVRLQVFLNDEIIMAKELALAASEQKTVSVQDLNAPGILKAVIFTDDSLLVDNTAYAVINEIKPVSILLVSDNYHLKDELEKIEQSTHRIALTHIITSNYDPEMIKNYDAAIFHRFIPENNPDINSLYIAPSVHSPISQAEEKEEKRDANAFSNVLALDHNQVSPVKILDWDNTHPVMRHLNNLDDLKINRAFTMKTPEWSKPLIMVSGKMHDAPIAFAGRYMGKKIVTLGIDLSDFDFSKPDGLQLLIMTLNIIQWLNPFEKDNHNMVLTGGEYRHDHAFRDAFIVTTPKNETTEYNGYKDGTETDFVFNRIDFAGVYKISGAGFSDRFVANLFDENESRIAPEATVDVDLGFEEKEAETLVKDTNTEFGKYLLLLVPLILLAEWLLYYRKARAGAA